VSNRAPYAGPRARPWLSGPELPLTDHTGSPVDVRKLAGESPLAIYFYPGAACSFDDGYDSPKHDEAQHRAFTAHHADFLARNCVVLGVSSQPHEQQHVAAAHTSIEHLLVSDPELLFARHFDLRTFTVDDIRLYCRSMMVLAGELAHVFTMVRTPEGSPAQAITWMRNQGI
jgi:peroxiredoxin